MTNEIRNPSWRPATFTSSSIDKIKRGLMTQMIRRIYPQPHGKTFVQDATIPLHWRCPDENDPKKKWNCPYGIPGDRLWVRQVWARVEPAPQVLEQYGMPVSWKIEKNFVLLDYWRKRVIFLSDFPDKSPEECGHGASDNVWRSPGLMPRWASRHTLKITEIRARRMQEISPDDVRAADVEAVTDEWVWHVFFRRIDNDQASSQAVHNGTSS
jgi:hypothetical protein